MEQSSPAPVAQPTVEPQPRHEALEVAAESRHEPGPSIPHRPVGGGNDQNISERQVRLQTTSISSGSDSPGNHIAPRPIHEYTYADPDRGRYPSYVDPERGRIPPPPRSYEGYYRSASRRYRPGVPQVSLEEIDHDSQIQRSIRERLEQTIIDAQYQRDKFARRAYWIRILINGAIALQVILGALTTGLAASVTTVKQGQISTAILGGLSTLVASFLARVRGSEEPELSLLRKRDLDAFLREARSFTFDHGHEYCKSEDTFDHRIYELRNQFEALLKQINEKKKQQPVPRNQAKDSKGSNAPNSGGATNLGTNHS